MLWYQEAFAMNWQLMDSKESISHDETTQQWHATCLLSHYLTWGMLLSRKSKCGLWGNGPIPHHFISGSCNGLC